MSILIMLKGETPTEASRNVSHGHAHRSLQGRYASNNATPLPETHYVFIGFVGDGVVAGNLRPYIIDLSSGQQDQAREQPDRFTCAWP
jgi:hypothetical protein